MDKSENIDVISGEDYVSPLAGNPRWIAMLAIEKVVLDLCDRVAEEVEKSGLKLDEILKSADVSKRDYKRFMREESTDILIPLKVLYALGYEVNFELRVISSDG